MALLQALRPALVGAVRWQAAAGCRRLAGAAGEAGGTNHSTPSAAEAGSKSTSSGGLLNDEAVMVLPLPKLSHAMTSGRIARWHVAEGHKVNIYDVLMTVETDSLVDEAYKVDQFAGTVRLLVESQEEGHLARQLVGEGAEVPVGTPVALLCEEQEQVEQLRRLPAPRGNVYDDRAAAGKAGGAAGMRQLEWQSYLAEGDKKSGGCM